MSASVTGSKWVGLLHLDKYNANLVIQDFKQEYGIHNEETFAPVKKITTVRTWLGVIDLQLFVTGLWQMDVKTQNAFLHGDFMETIYICPPHG